jgi:hypothetical protein
MEVWNEFLFNLGSVFLTIIHLVKEEPTTNPSFHLIAYMASFLKNGE